MDATSAIGGAAPVAAMKHLLQDPKAGAAKDVATGFEAILLRQLLHDLRKTTSVDGETSYTSGFYNDMFDDYLAEHLAGTGRLGLADVIRTYVERGDR